MDEANAQGVDPDIILAIAEHESGMRNNAKSAKNSDGSRDHGVMQINDKYHKLKNPYDPHENIKYGVKHFKGLLAGAKGDVRKALSDYNAGAGATGKGRQQGDTYAQEVLAKYSNLTGKTSPSKGTTTGGASNMDIQKAKEDIKDSTSRIDSVDDLIEQIGTESKQQLEIIHELQEELKQQNQQSTEVKEMMLNKIKIAYIISGGAVGLTIIQLILNIMGVI